MSNNKLPNGWLQPSFLNVDEEDGSLHIEWFFSTHDVSFFWCPVEGAMATKTTGTNQQCVEGKEAGKALKKWLDEGLHVEY